MIKDMYEKGQVTGLHTLVQLCQNTKSVIALLFLPTLIKSSPYINFQNLGFYPVKDILPRKTGIVLDHTHRKPNEIGFAF